MLEDSRRMFMIATAHLIAGTLVAVDRSLPSRSERRPWIFYILVIAPVLHLVLDLIPHWDPNNLGSNYLDMWTPAWWEAGIENVGGFILVSAILYRLRLHKRFEVWAFIICTWFPDVLSSLVMSGRIDNPLIVSIQNLHWMTHIWWHGWYGDVPNLAAAILGISTNAIVITLSWRYLIAACNDPGLHPRVIDQNSLTAVTN